MSRKRYVVVGGVAAGATAIARLRRLDEQAEIILLEKGNVVSFANCGLPYYIGGVIKDRNALFVSTPEAIASKYNIDVRTNSEVIGINPENKSVTVKSETTYELAYDKLLIATGSTPIHPHMEGFDGENVFTLWNIPDTDRIYKYIEDNDVQHAVVIGGGFIGLEMVENLVHRGIHVHLIEKSNQVMTLLDEDMAKLVENHLVDQGVDLRLNNGVEKIIHDNKSAVVLENGEIIPCDMIILSIGIRPQTSFLNDSGIQMNKRGGVIVNRYMETSIKDIYAAGDIVEVDDFNTQGRVMVPLAGPANKQGRVAADNMVLGHKSAYRGTQATSIAKVFDLSVASTGLNEKQLKALHKVYGQDYRITLIHPNEHAGYYPGATPLTLKLIFDMNGIVLGAQIIGYNGVDKRIDVIASTIHYHGTVEDLTELELAYAPPYSSAKDPVNFAGYTAVNQLEGLVEVKRVEELNTMSQDEILLDIREESELMMGVIPHSIHIPLSQLRNRLPELDKNKTYIVYCAVGLRGYLAARILMQNNIHALNLLGGYRTYSDEKKELVVRKNDSCCMKNQNIEPEIIKHDHGRELDVSGLCCPGPIVRVAKTMEDMQPEEVLHVTATDPGFYNDITAWCKNTGHELLAKSSHAGQFEASIRKNNICTKTQEITPPTKEKTMIVFSGDFDKAIASFIIATGAAAMGNQVNMFFTFWGLNIIRKNEKVKVKKNMISKMFGMMMPRGSKKLALSKMNMGGMGAKMIRSVMKKQNVDSLEDLIQQAMAAGVKLTACQMSMDVMGIHKEELLDGVEVGGVASMLDDNDHSNMNLFI